jgi:hypothetical protein
MKSKQLVIALSILFISVYSSTSYGQMYCGSTSETVQDVLGSRTGKSDAYGENVTLGVSFLLSFECDSALSYLKQAYAQSQVSALDKLIHDMGGETSGSAGAQPVSSPAPVVESTPQPSAPAETSTAGAQGIQPSADSEPVRETARSFTSEDINAFQSKGLGKVKQLTEYLNKIVNKSLPSSTAQTTIDNALLLFDSENHTVEVSSLSRPDKSRFPVRTYLNRLRMLNYQKVVIEGASFTYVSAFRKGPDGNYYGVARFRQSFTGYRDDKPVYSDVTTKTVAVVLKPYQKAMDGELVENWDVFLGDISVTQTEK